MVSALPTIENIAEGDSFIIHCQFSIVNLNISYLQTADFATKNCLFTNLGDTINNLFTEQRNIRV